MDSTMSASRPAASGTIGRAATRSSALDWGTALKMTALVAAAAVVPSLGLRQEITGPLVNALLLLSVGAVGIPGAMLVGALPSIIAIGRGTHPLPLLPMVPFIVLGNAAFVGVFGMLRGRGFAPAAVVASVAKLAVLSLTATYVVQLPGPLATMMGLPQLYTALAGAIIAYAAERAGGAARTRIAALLGL
jgi:hypothetical protein